VTGRGGGYWGKKDSKRGKRKRWGRAWRGGRQLSGEQDVSIIGLAGADAQGTVEGVGGEEDGGEGWGGGKVVGVVRGREDGRRVRERGH